MVKGDFLPALDADFAQFKQGADALDVVLAHLVLGLQALALHECLHIGTLGPGAIGDLVTTQMHDLQFQSGLLVHLGQLFHHTVDKAVNVITGDIEHIVVVTLGRGVNALVLLVPQAELLGSRIVHGTVFHRHDGGAGMTRRLNLGDDVNPAGPGITQQVDELVTGKVAIGAL